MVRKEKTKTGIIVRIAAALAGLMLLVVCAGCGNGAGEGAEDPPEVTPQKAYMVIYPGTVVEFGLYEQDNDRANGIEPVEWIVLAKEDDAVLLISRDVIELKAMHSKSGQVRWKDTTLRKWLNTSFIDEVFDEDERSIILERETDPGVFDKVFILSGSEIEKYMGGFTSRTAAGSKSVMTKAGYSLLVDRTNGRSAWWTRDPEGLESFRYVSTKGELGFRGQVTQGSAVGIRPAVWVESVYPQLQKTGERVP